MYKFTRSSYFWNHSSELDTLVNQNSHAAPIRSVCGQALPSFPSPTPLLPPFCSRPIFRAARMRKPLSLGPNFVRIVRERLLHRLNSTRIHDNAGTKLKEIMHTDKKQQQTVHMYTQLANKSDIRHVFVFLNLCCPSSMAPVSIGYWKRSPVWYVTSHLQ